MLRLLGLSSLGECRLRQQGLEARKVLNVPITRYGTPFLLSLGLSEQLTSLVWLAGPISGLIAQPIIGAR